MIRFCGTIHRVEHSAGLHQSHHQPRLFWNNHNLESKVHSRTFLENGNTDDPCTPLCGVSVGSRLLLCVFVGLFFISTRCVTLNKITFSRRHICSVSLSCRHMRTPVRLWNNSFFRRRRSSSNRVRYVVPASRWLCPDADDNIMARMAGQSLDELIELKIDRSSFGGPQSSAMLD